MPKETFNRLSENKKENIENAIRKELSRVSISEMSINKIIYDANIPRGSFYQYFEDKEDAIKVIVNNYIDNETKLVKKLLIKNNGNIFKIIIEIYDYIIQQYYGDYTILYINIFDFLRKQTHTVIQRSEIDMSKYMDFGILEYNSKEDIYIMMKILSILMRSTILEVFRKKLTIKEGREQLEQEIKILQKGMMKD